MFYLKGLEIAELKEEDMPMVKLNSNNNRSFFVRCGFLIF